MTERNRVSELVNHLLLVVILMFILYEGRLVFIPMSYGLFIAIVMYPLCSWLEKHRWPRSVAVGLSLLLVILLFSLLVFLLVIELRVLQNELPELKERIQPSIEEFRLWLKDSFGFTMESQERWFQHQKEGLGSGGLFLGSLLKGVTSNLFILFIIPVFSALFLYNRSSFVLFIKLIVPLKYKRESGAILTQTVHTYFSYIKGMILVYLIVGILNSAGLLALGVRHALLFGFLTAIMTIIPYAGIIVSALLPISIAWIDTGAVWVPLGIVGVFSFVQYLEANVIFPKVVGTQLKVSTWTMLVFIIAGGIIWGVSGMILFIPAAGILKIISDHLEEWKAWNVLLSR